LWYLPFPEQIRRQGVSNGQTPDNDELRVIGVATGLGCSIVVALILCIGGGVLLDRQFGTSPVFTLLGVALGLATAGYQLWELTKVGNSKAQAGPLTRQISRLPMARASRPAVGQQMPASREHEE
jgi:F0F1-type ATP synthase assembly protein I